MIYVFILTIFTFYTNEAFCQDRPQSQQFMGKKTGVEITDAQPEDITSENYSDVITGFVFPNADLKDVIRAMSTDLNIRIIMDPIVGGNQKISIMSYAPITVAEAYQAFLSALAIHNLTVIRTGSFLKVVKTDDALKTNTRVYTGNKKVNNDQFITSIIKLKHIDAASLESKIKPFVDAKAVKSLIFYPPSNSVIISDYGLNVNKIKKIITSLDIPSQDVIFKVFRIKHAQAAKLTETLNKLLPTGRFSSSFSSWRGSSNRKSSYRSNKQPINIQSLSHDERTNSIIAMGNKEGLNKIKELIKQLDYYKDPELAGGIYVYKVKHGTAEELATTLNDLIGQNFNSSNRQKSSGGGKVPKIANPGRGNLSGIANNLQNVNTAQSFQDVRIIAEKNTNSLLIVSNKYNYKTILGILKKVDISRNQVFVKSIIMELSTDRSNEWQMGNYLFPEKGGGIARVGYGFNSLKDLASASGGATLFFPLSLFFQKPVNIMGSTISKNSVTDITPFAKANIPGLQNILSTNEQIKLPTLSSFIKFLQTTVGANILSTPQIMALDHQEATVSIEDKIPVLGERTAQANLIGQVATSITPLSVETALIITPHINPSVNSIRLKIEQRIGNAFKDATVPEELQKTNVAVKKRTIKTFITLKDKETAVLGGLIKETNSKTNTKIPILGDIPIIGWLFKNSTTERKKTNLIVFITPHIIRSAEEHRTVLSSKLKERMNFIRQFTGNEDPYKELTDQMLNHQEDDSPTNNFPEHEALEDFPSDRDMQKTEEISGTQEEEKADQSEIEKDYYKEEIEPIPNITPESNTNKEDELKTDDNTILSDTEEENEQIEVKSDTEEENPSFEHTQEITPEEEMIENIAPDESLE